MTSDQKIESTVENDVTKLEGVYEPVVVIELFTSQGCSSCPAADRLLNEVKTKHPKNVYTLSYHVDYWNYIGWKDPFSKAKYAERQSKYNRKLRYRGNYTPEVVVNGQIHFTGSNRSKMNAAIETFSAVKVENQVRITQVEQLQEKLRFDYEIDGDLGGKSIRSILVLDERTTEVRRGENRNRTITNSNIVIVEQSQELTNAKGRISIEVPNTVQKDDNLSLVLLVSNPQLDITAATKTVLEK